MQAVDCEVSLYPSEFLCSISISGVPDHAIVLKKGAIYMIIMNLNRKLINGSRVVYLRRVGKMLEMQLVAGEFKGEVPQHMLLCCRHSASAFLVVQVIVFI